MIARPTCRTMPTVNDSIARTQRIGLWAVLLAAIAFGSLGLFGQAAFARGIAIPTLLFWRFTGGALIVFVAAIALREAPLPLSRIPALCGLGVLYTLQAGLFLGSVADAGPSIAIMLLYTFPVIIEIGARVGIVRSWRVRVVYPTRGARARRTAAPPFDRDTAWIGRHRVWRHYGGARLAASTARSRSALPRQRDGADRNGDPDSWPLNRPTAHRRTAQFDSRNPRTALDRRALGFDSARDALAAFAARHGVCSCGGSLARTEVGRDRDADKTLESFTCEANR